MEGSCLCGAITVHVTDADLYTRPRGHLCHCENCRKTAGSTYGANLSIESEKVKITGEDKLKEYKDSKTLSGNTISRFFCRECGNPIQSLSPGAPGKTILKCGLFSRIPQPEAEVYVTERQKWEKPYEGMQQFKTKMGGEKLEGSE
ncbi:MAG: hypothetical protein M1830_009911 [Pleopsidium flavum]|nr:MAG: hypothetical protein M1830_009911 [Pleopsidium flavum]